MISFPTRATQPFNYHGAKWNEPLITDIGAPGERGLLPPASDTDMRESGSRARAGIPSVRQDAARLPEVGQAQVLRHMLRLSQETLGSHLNVDIGQGTCTIKYNPMINDDLALSDEVAQLHPLQPESTVQGMLQIFAEMEEFLCKVSGLSACSLQPGSGSAAIYTNIRMVQAYHRSRGEEHRNIVITTSFSHPSNAATARSAGYEVVTIESTEDGYPSVESLREVLTENVAALMITNPEDIGVYNPHIKEFVDLVHEHGGLAIYDQANANALLGITRAADAGFDACQFNLHKTFGAPHFSGGPASGACLVAEKLEPFLPAPVVVKRDGVYALDHDRPLSIGKVRPFYGVTGQIVRAYAWILALGDEGLEQVTQGAVLNNNYLLHELLQIEGIEAPLAPNGHRLEQVRFSLKQLADRTGVRSAELAVRMADFGFHYWTSHHPYVVPEPATFETTESYSRSELDQFIASLKAVVAEAEADPELVQSAPHRVAVSRIDDSAVNTPETWIPSMRSYRSKYLGEAAAEVPRWEPFEGLPEPRRNAPAAHR
ncbi:aminomethyl-transferring glycine dehydrogenase subunit GcvPB [Leucobacter sp. USHLN153]|uniref:aminomethyl-transferring glycine dehydrogenase subunit GcvPB n=1 Tax=Leucobacter sp. USHLN153 TaxID=3081268 RepID=UPI00301691E8